MRIPKPTYSNVAATLALFLALSGGAYAISLGKNSVKRKNIAKGAVSTKKLAKNAVTGAKAKESSFGAVPNAANAAKLGGVGPAGYVTGINSIQRVKVEAVPLGGDGVSFSLSGLGTVQFRNCTTPGGAASMGDVIYDNTSDQFVDLLATTYANSVAPTLDYRGVDSNPLLLPTFAVPINETRARIDLQLGSRGSPHRAGLATLAFHYDGGPNPDVCRYTLWMSKVEEEQG